MHSKTRSHRPKLVPGLGEVTRKGRIDKRKGKEEELRDHITSREGKGSAMSFSLESPNKGIQNERNSSPFGLKSKESQETDEDKKTGNIVRTEKVGVGTHRVRMTAHKDRQEPPPIPSIGPLVRPQGFPTPVPRNLVVLDICANLPKFWGKMRIHRGTLSLPFQGNMATKRAGYDGEPEVYKSL